MAKKSVVRDLNGNIINLIDESDGGWIIRNRQVVNPEKWERIQAEERDRMEAAKAIALQKVDENAPDRNVIPTKLPQMADLEKKFDDFKKDTDEKFNAIMAALKK